MNRKWTQIHYKYLLSNGNALVSLVDTDRDIQPVLATYDKELEVIDSRDCDGSVIGVVNEKYLIFDNIGRGEEGSAIVVRSAEDLSVVSKLDIDFRYDKKDCIRACGNPESGHVAVVSRNQQRLDIFEFQGAESFKAIYLNTVFIYQH